MRPLLLSFITLLCFSSVTIAADPAYLDELVGKAREQQLAKQREWLDLVHYEPRLIGGHGSLADSPSFFNSPEGKTNPQAELEATLAAFFSEEPETDKSQNPQCRFIARYHWLKSKLDFDATRLPEQKCNRFETWYKAIDPERVTLIFPAAYINNPSSMFGHTLLRVDPKGQSEKTRLFSYALNFAASTNETNGVVFVAKALTGGYPGNFSIMPYYEKVKEYNDVESRDIWEYRLNLNPEEVRRLLEHAWELGQINFDYYFFDENCSYQLLALLDVARPGMQLTDRFPGWAIPSDTVKVMVEDERMLEEAVYRPANSTIIRHRRSLLTKEEQLTALRVAKGEADVETVTALPAETRPQVLELAYNYLQYLLAEGELERNEAAPRSLAILKKRGTLPVSTATPTPPVPSVRPEEGHDTARIALGVGAAEGDEFYELRIRPAYHDLLDPVPGYARGAQINFFDITARYWPDEEATKLQSFWLFDIFSVSPRDEYFQSLSWKTRLGAERLPLITSFAPEMFYTLDGALGPAVPLTENMSAYAMVEGTLLGSSDLPKGAAVGAGPALGLLWQRDGFALHARTRLQRYASDLNSTIVDSRLEIGYALNRNMSLRLNGTYTEAEENNYTESSLLLSLHF